ncbi:MAG: NAD(P)/FAD-dependent oxidoreductase [archaeon]|nr:NAD(P)/FAD-dependent oxidoreductase [archaeon]
MQRDMYDVIIAGGGPAGSIAAERAARDGLDVLMLEKAVYPRNKTCGGGVSQKSLDVIGGIDKELIERETFGARIFLPDYRNFAGMLDDRVAVMTRRENLDHWLANRAEDAGAVVQDGEAVKDVLFNKDCVEVVTSKNRYRSRMIIGSDGVNSTVAKRSGIRTRWGDDIGLCLEAEVKLGETAVEECVGDRLTEFYFIGDRGYGWIFPKRDRISIGIGEFAPRVDDLKGSFNRFVRDVSLQKNIDIEGRISGINNYRIPTGGYPRRTHGDRVLLAGDAAGFVDPFLGEGIYYAVKSGEIAADVAAGAVESDDFSERFLQDYVVRCEKEFNYDLKSALNFANFAYGHRNIFLKALWRDKRLFMGYMRTVRGDRTYTEFNRWCARRSPVTLAKLIIGR